MVVKVKHCMPKIFDQSSRFQRLLFNENPNVGVFCRATDEYAFLKKGLSKKIKSKICNALDVAVIELSISDASIIGSLLTGNSSGVIATDFITEENIKCLTDEGIKVCVIDDIFNAAGNDILINDTGCLVHPEMHEDSLARIKETFNIPVYRGTIAQLNTVGMAAVVTNNGLLCHPKVTDQEKDLLKKVFDVPVMIGTVNHGVPLIGSGLVANRKGAIMGALTTGIEMGRIEEALHFDEAMDK
jgi:translation initiation factor 6